MKKIKKLNKFNNRNHEMIFKMRIKLKVIFFETEKLRFENKCFVVQIEPWRWRKYKIKIEFQIIVQNNNIWCDWVHLFSKIDIFNCFYILYLVSMSSSLSQKKNLVSFNSIDFLWFLLIKFFYFYLLNFWYSVFLFSFLFLFSFFFWREIIIVHSVWFFLF